MRIIIDLTNSPHVPFFAPLVRRLRAQGHDVVITARRFAQTVELAELHGLDVHVIGAHGGATRIGKARAALRRTWGLHRHLRSLHRSGEPFAVGFSHGSTDLPIACRRLGIPHVTMFDYEWARTMHRTNVRNSWRVMTPDLIDPARLDEYGAAGKLVQYPGLKEEYYLSDARLDPAIRAQLGIDPDALLCVLRPPPELALYHRGHHNEVFGAVIERIAATPGAVVVLIPRTAEQGAALVAAHGEKPSVVIPDGVIDALSLIAQADLVVSAGGTMNREAVALGIPVYTVFAGRMGGVDEQLIAQGRLRQLTSAQHIDLVRRARAGTTPTTTLRDPQSMLDLALDGLPYDPHAVAGGDGAAVEGRTLPHAGHATV